MTPTTNRLSIVILLLVCLHGTNGFGLFSSGIFGTSVGSSSSNSIYNLLRMTAPKLDISKNNLVQRTVSGVKRLNSVAHESVESHVKSYYRISLPRFSLACAYKRVRTRVTLSNLWLDSVA